MSEESLQMILALAAVSRKFRQVLVGDPVSALRSVREFLWDDEDRQRLSLTREDYLAVSGIRANSLEEFAAQLEERSSQLSKGRRNRGHPAEMPVHPLPLPAGAGRVGSMGCL